MYAAVNPTMGRATPPELPHPSADAHAQAQAQAQEAHERAQVAVRSLEFARAVSEAETLDDVFLLLTNDIRVLAPFDRSFLVSRFEGKPRFIAAGGVIAPETKSKFYKEVAALSRELGAVEQTVFVSRGNIDKLEEFGVTAAVRDALARFLAFSGAAHFLCVPLRRGDLLLGHLMFELMEETLPDRHGIMAIQQIEPFLSSAVLEKWLREHNPEALDAVSPAAGIGRTLWVQQIKKWGIAAALAILLGVALFLIPFPYTVGGEAEIAPMERHFAFSRIEGLIAAVNVREGGHVRKGDVLCSIDPKDLDFRIGIVKRELETLTREAAILVDGAGARPAQLARAEIVELNRRKKSKELEYLVNQRAHVQVTAPVDGVVVTKGVEAATGKRLAQGEPFCEVAALTELGAEVHVPDDRITRVKPGQTVSVYLNSDPSKAHTLRVFEISPKAEPFARLGNIFRVKARVEGDSEFGMSGMKGIGKIDTGTACLWTMLNDRLKARWNGFTGALM